MGSRVEPRQTFANSLLDILTEDFDFTKNQVSVGLSIRQIRFERLSLLLKQGKLGVNETMDFIEMLGLGLEEGGNDLFHLCRLR